MLLIGGLTDEYRFELFRRVTGLGRVQAISTNHPCTLGQACRRPVLGKERKQASASLDAMY